MNQMGLLGLDDGHYAIKICAGKDKFFTLRSSIMAGREVVSDEDGRPNDELVFYTDNNEYYTITAYHGLADKNIDTRDKDFAVSSANRALCYHALSRARDAGIITSKELFVVSGLPVNRFYDEKGVLDNDFILLKRNSLLMPINNMAGVNLPVVAQHQIVSEAVASFFDAAYDFDGTPNEQFLEAASYAPVAIIDVGGKTLDVAVVREGGNGLYFSRSGTFDTGGALYFYDALNDTLMKYLQEQYPDVNVTTLSKDRIDQAVKTGKIHYYTLHDVSDIVQAELLAFADRVRNFVQPKLGNGADYSSILFVGGGSNLLYNHVERVFPNIPKQAIQITEPTEDLNKNSSFSNARGMYKAALLASR